MASHDEQGLGPAPVPGSALTLIGQADGEAFDGTVQTWDPSDDGLVVNTRVRTSPAAIARLADHRVWVSVAVDGHGVIVCAGVARPVPPDMLEIRGVVPVIRERRRRAPRASTKGQATFTSPDRPSRRLTVVDLGRGGVRVVMGEPTDLVLGERVTVEMQFEGGTTVRADGEVTRVDERAGQAVVRFAELPTALGSRIDHYVLLRLTSPT